MRLSSRRCTRDCSVAPPTGAILRVASHCTLRLSKVRAIALVVLLGLIGCGHRPQTRASSAPEDGWHEFQGTWTAAGTRQVMSLGGDRRASIASLDGSLLLAGPSRPDIGFRAEALVFNDTGTGMVGRATWTDERGDQAYSELRGEATATSNKITGTFLGGTGRYAGATGTYEFSWQFLLETEDGELQGESIGLKGRVRVGSSRANSDKGNPPS